MLLKGFSLIRTTVKYLPSFSSKKVELDYDLVYGLNPVEAALNANKREFISLMLSDSDRIELSSKAVKLMQLAKNKNLPIVFAPKEKMSRIVDHQPHQNIILKCSPIQLSTWNDQSTIPKGISIYCDKITDPQNFGAILRSALFFGATAVFTGKKHHCPLNTTVSKTSSGAMELMQIYGVSNSQEFMQKWKLQGGTIVATGVDLNKPHTTAHEIRSVLKSEGITDVLVILGS